MPSFGLIYPVLPGKESVVREVGSQLKERRSEREESRRRGGVTVERAYLQKNPDGSSLVVAYLEADRSFGEVMGALLSSDLPIDRYFIDKNQEATGVDFRAGPTGPEPELVGQWVAPGATQRAKGFAFAAPLQPGKTEAARTFAQEAYVTRQSEMAESRASKGLIREEVFLNQTPAGDMVVVYLEGNDPVDGNRQFAASNTPFDRWFKDRCREVFPAFINFDQPVPANEEVFSSA
ncbi:MAG TPA: DUF6176 family protein [Chloroflexota bacterium]|jgi:hypothetical protein